MDLIEKELRERVDGDVHFDSMSRHVYSVDSSIFEIVPLGIVIPKTREGLIEAVRIAHTHRIPITVRGAATGITGGCLGRGIILDTSKYLNSLLSIDVEACSVTCQPGLIQDDMNDALLPFKYRLGPDTSTGNRATLGGMLANNAAGARSLRFGKMSDHVRSVEVVLASGETLRFGPTTEQEFEKKRGLPTSEGRIYSAIGRIRERYGAEIKKWFPKIPRIVSGYALNELTKTGEINVAKLIAGSEGTLGIVTEINLDIVPVIAFSGLCLLYFDDLALALESVPSLLQHDPISLELIDDQIISLGRTSPSLRGRLDWLKASPKALLVMEMEGSSAKDLQSQLEYVAEEARRQGIGYTQTIVSDPSIIADVWALRKAGLGILLSKRTYSRAIAFLEDISVSPNQLAPFMKRFCDYLAAKGKTAGIYGHAGSGCMHIRPYMDLRDPEEVKFIRQMMLDVTDLLLDFGGTLSGEHGDGLIRSWLNPKLFGKELTQAFIELKQAFDPENLLNPGKIVFAAEPFEPLRSQSGQGRSAPVETFLNFKREGGFDLAVDLCNGNGQCRKKTGVMCPSFQVTHDEFHSTRARAQALRSVINGQLPLEDLTGDGMNAVMDLCISCKGCKTECPSQIDMAKMKAEFLYQRQEKDGYSLRSRLFGNIDVLFRLASPFAYAFNRLTQSTPLKKIFGLLGISTKRTLPPLAKNTFSTLFKNQPKHPSQETKPVVLFGDTFTEYNDPAIGSAAVKICKALGYHVILASKRCCGRPAISKGLLREARHKAIQVLDLLLPYALKEIPIIGLEPSCILTIKDDYPGLVPESMEKVAEAVASQCLTFDEFIANHLHQDQLPLVFKECQRNVLLHGHCHQKALVGMGHARKILEAVPGVKLTEIPSGCCGMAGSFGYEREHYEVSMRMGELTLFPFIQSQLNTSSKEASPSIPTFIVAAGTSCRQQIHDGTSRKALHPAEFIVLCLEDVGE
jgi:FAD/FMN-containing dehydrogenase/Fe-S oxidoreductase